MSIYGVNQSSRKPRLMTNEISTRYELYLLTYGDILSHN
jgi:hypothetical protein